MNAHAAEQWARQHQQDLLDEASRERLAAIARGSANVHLRRGAGSLWRRLLRSAVVNLGAWLAISQQGSASHHA